MNDLKTDAIEDISAQEYIQYFYTNCYIRQDSYINDDWVLNVTQSSPKSGLWTLWVNGKQCLTKDDGGTWSFFYMNYLDTKGTIVRYAS